MDTTTNDFKFQELCRVVDATTAKYNHQGLVTGHSCLSFIKSQTAYIEGFVSDDFLGLIKLQIELSEGKSNVREYVKKILTYPLKDYLPWIAHHNFTPRLYELSGKCEAIKFNFTMKDGKVYAFSEEKIAKSVFDCVKDIIPGITLNPETANDTHITLVNSNVVYDIGKENVEKFVEEYNSSFTVKLGHIMSTVSYDWPLFSDCYVISVESNVVDNFISEFNKTFNKSLKPSIHITFAVTLRTLF